MENTLRELSIVMKKGPGTRRYISLMRQAPWVDSLCCFLYSLGVHPSTCRNFR